MAESASIEIQTPIQKLFEIGFLLVNQYYKSAQNARILISQMWSERGAFELIQCWISYDAVVVFVKKFSNHPNLPWTLGLVKQNLWGLGA